MGFLKGCQPYKAMDAPIDGPTLGNEQTPLNSLSE